VVKYRFYILAVILLLLASCGEATNTLTPGKAAPAFTLERLDGVQIQFPTDLEGRVVAIQFWADWCPPCINEMIQLAPVYERYQPQGLVILAVNMGQDKDTVAELAEQLNAPYDFLLDIDSEVAKTYDVNALPTSFIIDRKGQLSTRILGESTPETFEKIIKGML